MQSVNRLLVDSVHLEFDKLQVLQSAFITAQTGRVTGVLGRNGCGKSCLFKCIMGGIKPQNIFVRFNDEPFSNVAPKHVELMQRLIKTHKATKGIIISDHMYEQVMDITDDLFLLRDGYTFPIKCREDLIHHGYILR